MFRRCHAAGSRGPPNSRAAPGPNDTTLNVAAQLHLSAARAHRAKGDSQRHHGALRATVGLTADNLADHFCRVYFIGSNAPSSNMYFHPMIPPELGPLVKQAEYAEYAERGNRLARWRSWERNFVCTLAVLYYPLVTNTLEPLQH